MKVLYWNAAEEGATLLMILGLATFFLCMVTVMTGILQAAGKERLPVIAAVIGGVVKVLVNRVMISNPAVNIYGAAIGTLCCFASVCLLDFLFMKSCFGQLPKLRHVILRPLLSTVLMGAAAWLVYRLCGMVLGAEPGRLLMLIYLGVSILVAVLVYGILVIKTRSVTAEDMKLIPKGEKIAKLLRMQ